MAIQASLPIEKALQERESILNNFSNKDIDALVAIRCLDEGIDIPACREAFILASKE